MIYKYTIICLMALIVLFVIHLLIININYSEVVAQEDDPKVPPGLYNATDKVALLTVHNFQVNVYNSTSAWLVQFYNTWCGHCIKFSPIWKQLAASIYNWRDVIKIGVIDCADEDNLPTCREYEANKKPTVRFFPPFMRNFSFGKNVSKPRENHDPVQWRIDIINELQNITTKPSHHWPNFLPVDSSTLPNELREKTRPMFLVVEKQDSYVGRELMLDLYARNVTVLYSFDTKLSDTRKNLPQVFVIEENNVEERLHLTNTTRYGVYKAVKNYLIKKEYDIPNITDGKTNNVDSYVPVEQSEKQLQIVNTVYMDDLESAVRNSLFLEVSTKSNISGSSLSALKSYLRIIDKYFPSNPNIRTLLKAIIPKIENIQYISGSDFKNLLLEQSNKSTPLKNKKWVGCKGSIPHLRGYPCSLWMTFHTLTVQAYVNQERSDDSTEVLNAMIGYIGNIFGCSECSEHFIEMSKTMAGNVTSPKDSVLWLWKAHNSANRRLHGNDTSEDPAFPKNQFPVEKMCPKCRQHDGSWNEDEVLSYLVKMYTNIVYNTDWRNVVVVGAIDCADDQNTQLCREYEIMGYPTIRYFPPLVDNFTIGKELSRVLPDPAILRTEIIKHLENTETKVRNWPDFSAINSDTIQSVWKVNNSRLLILVVEKDESFVGRELILDLYGVKNLMVRYTFNADFSNTKEQLPQVFVIKPDYTRIQLPLTNMSRHGVFKTVRNYLLNEGYLVPDIIETQSSEMHFKVKQSPKQQLLVNKVFMEDIESAVSYSLFHEVTLKPKIDGESMTALKGYLQVLGKYFPSNSNVHGLINAIVQDVQNIHSTTGGDFKRMINGYRRNLYPLKNKHWVSCKGTTAKYRGYPCSVWTLFHTLSVQAYVNPQRSTGSSEVITAMANYIKNFFGCQDCAEHFQEMSKTIAGNVSTLNDSVLWLWKAHNTVNRRLAGDFSEDPGYPKVQFPAKNMCPECRYSNDSWREDKVLAYLVNMYTNVFNVVTLSNGESSTELAKLISERYTQHNEIPDKWNFSFSDVKTCIALYVLSACLLTVYTVRFFMKRNRRTKSHMKYDFHSKA